VERLFFFWKNLDQITSARFTVFPGKDIYLPNGFTTPLPGPVCGIVIGLVDTIKWTIPFHRPDLVQWVQCQNLGREKAFLLSKNYIMVNTRSGLTTATPEPEPEAPSETDDTEEWESLETSEPEEPISIPLQIPGDKLSVTSAPQFRF
jgi:hypothetical protein